MYGTSELFSLQVFNLRILCTNIENSTIWTRSWNLKRPCAIAWPDVLVADQWLAFERSVTNRIHAVQRVLLGTLIKTSLFDLQSFIRAQSRTQTTVALLSIITCSCPKNAAWTWCESWATAPSFFFSAPYQPPHRLHSPDPGYSLVLFICFFATHFCYLLLQALLTRSLGFSRFSLTHTAATMCRVI